MPRGTGGFLNPDRIAEEFGIEEGANIADFGSGAGYFTISMAKIVGERGQVYAFDIVETALQSVRSKAMLASLLNIKTVRANLEILGGSGLEEGSIDLVLLANVLFQSSKKNDIIKEASRILKKEGKIIVIDWKENQVMGPPANLLVSEETIKKTLEGQGLKHQKSFLAGNSHWGAIFIK